MNNTNATVALVAWMTITLILVFSVIGLLLFIPTQNYTNYHMALSERRSTWMTIGVKLLNKVLT